MPLPVIYIVDDDQSFLTAIARLLRAARYDVKTYSTAMEFLTDVAPDTHGCLIADLEMPGLSGLDLQDALIKAETPLPVIFLTGHGDIPSTVRAMRGGAEDFLEKRAPKEQLLDAVQRALVRDAQAREQRARIRGLRARFDAVTPREREVLAHVLQGRLNKQIAYDLAINERTVKLHRNSFMRKLQVQSVAELTRLVQDAGLLHNGQLVLPET